MRRFLPKRWLPSGSPGNRLLNRCFTIMGITVLLLLPLGWLMDLVSERSNLHEEAVYNIASLWGGSQSVEGPALIIPYEQRELRTGTEEGRDERDTKPKYMVILPQSLEYEAQLETQNRYRGIYNFVGYSASVSMRGVYRLPEDGPFKEYRNRPLWDQAFFCFGVRDFKAITSMGRLAWNGGTAASFAPASLGALGSGFQTKVSVTPDIPEYVFSLAMTLNGSRGLFFTPVGETTSLSISGNWADPSFGGQVLPTSRTIDEDGFRAQWTIPHLSRTYPQSGDLSVYSARTSGHEGIKTFVAGVNLQEMLPLYKLVERAVKYAVLFIGLTFVALFSFELLSRRQLHLIQYGLVGIAMCLFYLVLLSLAEHIAFAPAFAAASAVCVAMNGLYIRSALRSWKKGLLIAMLLGGLYAVLYALLQLEGYAILVGTALVVVAVCALMYMTRNLRPESPEQDGVPGDPAVPYQSGDDTASEKPEDQGDPDDRQENGDQDNSAGGSNEEQGKVSDSDHPDDKAPLIQP